MNTEKNYEIISKALKEACIYLAKQAENFDFNLDNATLDELLLKYQSGDEDSWKYWADWFIEKVSK